MGQAEAPQNGGRLQGVVEQAYDRHGPDPTWYGVIQLHLGATSA